MSKEFVLYGTHTSGPVYKVALALSLLGKPYSYRYVDFAVGEHKSAPYLAINRYGQVPALVPADGRILVQSAAILEHLADSHGQLGGKDAAERQLIREWLYWDADKLAPGIYRARAIKRGKLVAAKEVADFFTAAARDGLSVLERHLAGRSWLVGDAPTIADIAIYGVASFAPQAGLDLADWPAVAAFVRRFEALPGWRPQAELAPDHHRD
jgi:glutathione S-transferase